METSRTDTFGHYFVHPTCFDTAPVRRRRAQRVERGEKGERGERFERSEASSTPPSSSSGRSLSSLSSARSPRTPRSPRVEDIDRLSPGLGGIGSSSASTSNASANMHKYATPAPKYSPSAYAGTPSWCATSGSLALASFGKRACAASCAAGVPVHAVLRSGVDLTSHYRNYVRALNTRALDLIGRYVAATVTLNGNSMAHTEFCALIPPGAVFMPEDIIVDFPNRTVAARLYIEYPVGGQALAGQAGQAGQTGQTGGQAGAQEGAEEERRNSETAVQPSRRRIRQVDEMAFYRFDDEWRIEVVNSMTKARTSSRRGSDGSASEDEPAEPERSQTL